MAKLTDKSALTTPANDDLLYIVDVSDTTDSAQGTSKKIEVQNLVGSTIPQSYLDTDGTLASNSDTKIATQKATKTYADTKLTNSMTTDRLLGRGTSGTGAVEEITLGTNLNLVGTTLNSALTFRNILINGDMSVAQRSTSTASITTNGYYTADRWEITQASGTVTVTQSVENDAPTGTGLRKSLKNTFTTGKAALAAGDFFLVRQKIEGQNVQNVLKGTANAKQLTVSFWVKASVTGTYIAELFDNDNTRQVSASYSISASNTWEFKTITYPADTTGAFDNDTLISLILQFYVTAGTNYTSGTLNTTWGAVTTANRAVGQVNGVASNNNFFQITGVQLEVADEASEFEYIPNDVNYQRCLRYCYVLGGYGNLAITARGLMYANNAGRVWVNFPVKMRGTPTATISSNDYEILGVGPTTGTFANPFYSIEAATWDGINTPTTGALGRAFSYTGAGNFSAEL